LEQAGTNSRGAVDRQQVAELLGVRRQTVEQWVRNWRENQNGKSKLAGISPDVRKKLLGCWFNKRTHD
jgi:hypothetical protein